MYEFFIKLQLHNTEVPTFLFPVLSGSRIFPTRLGPTSQQPPPAGGGGRGEGDGDTEIQRSSGIEIEFKAPFVILSGSDLQAPGTLIRLFPPPTAEEPRHIRQASERERRKPRIMTSNYLFNRKLNFCRLRKSRTKPGIKNLRAGFFEMTGELTERISHAPSGRCRCRRETPTANGSNGNYRTISQLPGLLRCRFRPWKCCRIFGARSGSDRALEWPGFGSFQLFPPLIDRWEGGKSCSPKVPIP